MGDAPTHQRFHIVVVGVCESSMQHIVATDTHLIPDPSSKNRHRILSLFPTRCNHLCEAECSSEQNLVRSVKLDSHNESGSLVIR